MINKIKMHQVRSLSCLLSVLLNACTIEREFKKHALQREYQSAMHMK